MLYYRYLDWRRIRRRNKFLQGVSDAIRMACIDKLDRAYQQALDGPNGDLIRAYEAGRMSAR